MSPLAWVVVVYIAANGTVQITKAGLNYRTTRRRDTLARAAPRKDTAPEVKT